MGWGGKQRHQDRGVIGPCLIDKVSYVHIFSFSIYTIFFFSSPETGKVFFLQFLYLVCSLL